MTKLNQHFDISITRSADGVQIRLESLERSALVDLERDEALRLLLQLGQAALHVDEEDARSRASMKPALVARHPGIAWGAIDDGLIALSVFLPGLRPIMAAFEDDQARDILEGLEQVLAIPKGKRLEPARNH